MQEVDVNPAESELNQAIQVLSKLQGYDPNQMETLARETNDEVVLKILAEFRRSLMESISKFEVLKVTPNPEDLYRVCHKLTGSAELLGFKSLGQSLRYFKNTETSKSATPTEIETLIGYCKSLLTQIPNPETLS